MRRYTRTACIVTRNYRRGKNHALTARHYYDVRSNSTIYNTVWETPGDVGLLRRLRTMTADNDLFSELYATL